MSMCVENPTPRHVEASVVDLGFLLPTGLEFLPVAVSKFYRGGTSLPRWFCHAWHRTSSFLCSMPGPIPSAFIVLVYPAEALQFATIVRSSTTTKLLDRSSYQNLTAATWAKCADRCRCTFDLVELCQPTKMAFHVRNPQTHVWSNRFWISTLRSCQWAGADVRLNAIRFFYSRGRDTSFRTCKLVRGRMKDKVNGISCVCQPIMQTNMEKTCYQLRFPWTNFPIKSHRVFSAHCVWNDCVGPCLSVL